MRQTLHHIRAQFSTSARLAAVTPHMRLSHRARAAVYLTRLGIRILKQWALDKCPQQAAALTFSTALSLVPVTAIAFTILRSVSSLDAQSQLTEFISNRLFPGMDAITDRIEQFSSNISAGALGGAGLFITLITCYSLYSYVERIFNDIWRVGQRRSLIGKFLTFYAMVTLLPALASVSLYWSGKLIGAGAAARFLTPLAIQFVGLLLMNKLLPRANVSWSAALSGALLTAVALEVLKFGSVRFAKKMLLDSYSGVYGSVGLIPLLLMWIYVSWLVVLLGVEIAFAVQNLRLLEAEDRRQRGDEPVNGMVAAQLLAVVAAARERGSGAVSKKDLVDALGISPDNVERIAARLKTRGLIAEVQGDLNGYIPGREASTIRLEEVLAAFRTSDLELADGAAFPALRALVADLDTARAQRTAGVMISNLVPSLGPNAETAAPEDPGRSSTREAPRPPLGSGRSEEDLAAAGRSRDDRGPR